MIKNFSLLLIVLLSANCSTQQISEGTKRTPSYDIEFVDYLFRDYNGEKPSASVIIIKDGIILFSKSYGYANLEDKRLATPNTNYRIASVTKQFTAMAIMILINQNKLDYHTRLTDIFSEFPEYGRDITIEQLLTHRSGLVKYNRFITKDQTEQMLDKDVLNGLFRTDSTYFEPNSKYAYSNTGYAVLAQVIEKVSGLTFRDFMHKNIFQPLKMNNSSILEIGKEIDNRAYGYIVKDKTIIAKDQSLTSAIQGDGGVYTSILDYCKWDNALYTNEIIPQTEMQKAFFGYNENGISKEEGYGFGWNVKYENGIKTLSHGGSSAGFGSYVIRIPDEKLTVAIFTNRNKRGSELLTNSKGLISYFSEGRFKMPIMIDVGKEIDENGIDKGLILLNEIKTDTIKYEVSKESLFNFSIDYINGNRSNDAYKILDQIILDYPDYFGGYYGKAVILKKRNKKEKAIKYFEKTVEKCTSNEIWAKTHSNKMILELRKE